MKKFEDLIFKYSGYIRRSHIYFDNCWGISVVSFNPFSNDIEYEYEVAILDWEGNISYDSGITNDVISGLTPDEVTEVMALVERL